MRYLILFISLLSLLMLVSTTANACTCIGPSSPCESYGSAGAVFVGTPISVREAQKSNKRENDWEPRVFKFSVEQSYLGVAGTEIEVSTGMGGGDCGYSFKIGERYLVYAYQGESRLTTGICTRTRPFRQATEDLAFLGNLSSAAPGATIYGQIVPSIAQKKDSLPFGEDFSVRIEGEDVKHDIRPDAEGRYRIAGLPPGKFKVTLQAPDAISVDRPEQEVKVSDRGCAAVAYYIQDNGRLSGSVIDAEGQPVARIVVTVHDPASDPREKWVTLDRTDSEGRFNFSAIPAGRYLLGVNFNRFPEPNDPTNAYPPTFFPGVVDQPSAEIITLAPGEKRTGLEIRMLLRRSASVIKGQVVWADGSPVATARLIVIDISHGNLNPRMGEVDQQGRFTINGYVGQKLILAADSPRPNVPNSQGPPQDHSEPVRIMLQRPIEPVRIVITKRL